MWRTVTGPRRLEGDRLEATRCVGLWGGRGGRCSTQAGSGGVLPLYLSSSYFQSCPRLQLPVLGKPHPTWVPSSSPARAPGIPSLPHRGRSLQLPDPGPAAALREVLQGAGVCPSGLL